MMIMTIMMIMIITAVLLYSHTSNHDSDTTYNNAPWLTWAAGRMGSHAADMARAGRPTLGIHFAVQKAYAETCMA